jgi:hypothetical protein
MTRRTHVVKFRARGQLLLRRLEPEAAGPPRGRFVAVPRRPSRERSARSIGESSGCANRTWRDMAGDYRSGVSG